MNKTAAAGTGLLALLVLTACAGVSEETADPNEEPSSVATVAAEPESGQTPATDSPEDAWLVQAREDHLDDLEEWHNEYADADCVAHEPQCHDLFAEGLPVMADYNYWIRNQAVDLPEYVSASHLDDVTAATRALVSWSYACPDDEDCREIALDAQSKSSDVITEASSWAEE